MNRRYIHMRQPGKPALLDLPGAGLGGETLRVLEPPSAERRALIDSIVQGYYGRPFIGESAEARSLHFSIECVQSRMRLADPDALDLLYTRKAMSFLLFLPAPRNILMLGLGGGSLAKYCHRHLPATRVKVVEIDADVIALRDYFHVPPPSNRFEVVEGDAARYVASDGAAYDVVIADAFDRAGISPSIRSDSFYENVRGRLREGGILVANFAGERPERLEHLAMMARAFSDNVLLLPVEGEGNEIALAFNQPNMRPGWKSVRERAAVLGPALGLDFARFAGRLERSEKLGYLRRTLARPLAG